MFKSRDEICFIMTHGGKINDHFLSNFMVKNRSTGSGSLGKLQIFARLDYAYIKYDIHMNIRTHFNTKYGYQIQTSCYSDRQIIIV